MTGVLEVFGTPVFRTRREIGAKQERPMKIYRFFMIDKAEMKFDISGN
jgi:hypothetical protein